MNILFAQAMQELAFLGFDCVCMLHGMFTNVFFIHNVKEFFITHDIL